jgi:tetratricopeptide (TPR) repeat protein
MQHWYRKGISEAQSKQFDRALVCLQNAVRLDPSATYVYYALSSVHLKLRNFKEALDTSNVAIKLDATDRRFYAQRAPALIGLNRLREALANAEALICNEPSAESYLVRADVHQAMQHIESTKSDLKLAIYASEQAGEDAMDECERWEMLTHEKATRPMPNLGQSENLVHKIAQLLGNQNPLTLNTVQAGLGVTLVEDSEYPRGLRCYRLKSKGGVFESITYNPLLKCDSEVCSCYLDVYKATVTLDQLEKACGKPNKLSGDPIKKVIYERPWGRLILTFQQHGFQSLTAMSLAPPK